MSGFAFTLVFGALFVIIARTMHHRPQLPFPPGPWPLPFVGNVFDLPSARPWEKYHEWCRKYNSDIIFLQLPIRPVVILGSAKAAVDLLEKRSRIYSDRIRSIMVELMGWDFNFGLMPYGSKWRAHRRMFNQHFYPQASRTYTPVQLEHSRMLLSWILRSPERTPEHLRHAITSIIFTIVYGKRIPSMDHEYVTAAEHAVEGLNLGTLPGSFWIEFAPIFKSIPAWFPGATFRKFAKQYKPYIAASTLQPYNEVKEAIQTGVAPHSLARTLIEEVRMKYGGTEDEASHDEVAKNVAGVAYAAAADTTSIASKSFLLAMALYPDVQFKAQEELDRVIGPHRLPNFEDIQNLPYIRAVLMENVWAMTRNTEDYPEPDQFKPERFLQENGTINPSVRDPATIAFGFGRRVCPGRHFAMNTLSMIIASVLHVFTVEAGVDGTGKPVELSTEMFGILIAEPRDVPCGLKPRSETATKLILEVAASSREA